MAAEFLVISVSLMFLFRAVAGESPASAFCGDEEMTITHKEIPLGTGGQSRYFQIFCGCNCNGDANSLLVYEQRQGAQPRTILSVGDILSFSLLGGSSNGLRDIAVSVREDPDKPYSGHILDTLAYNGKVYVKRTNHTDRVATLDPDPQTAPKIAAAFPTAAPRNPNGPGSLADAYASSLAAFKSGQKLQAAQSLLAAAGPKPWTIDNSTVAVFNDLGYFLEQAGQSKDAVDVLTAVIAAFPDRTVAYLNLADAYAGLKDPARAKANYRKYIDLMTKAGKQAKVPTRVMDAVR